VGLDAWMVLFGAVPDLAVGGVAVFALRAIPVFATIIPAATPAIERIAMNYYRLTGKVVTGFRGEQMMMTPGGRLYLGSGVVPASWDRESVTGEFELVVDVDAVDGGRPRSEWRVEGIARETANWRERRLEENRPIGPGRRLLRFSKLVENPGLRFAPHPIERTNALNDDGGLAHYNLDVRLIPSAEDTQPLFH